MSSTHAIGNEGTVEEASNERISVVVEETAELRPSVEQEIQAKVDTNHPDVTPGSLTLEEEERLAAREWEVERTVVRYDRHQTSDREKRTSRVVEERSIEQRRAFERRAASVDPWADPERADPREELSRGELATVNREAARLASKLQGWSRAAISRRLAERVVDGRSTMGAIVGTFEELQRAPGRVVPIATIGEVPRREVNIQGEVTTLWEPSHPTIAQVGLIEDESGTTRFTVWKASKAPRVEVGEHVVFRNVAKSWFGGRVSVALTGWSSVIIREYEGWWAE